MPTAKRRDNPSCGDHVTVYLNLEEGVIKDISFKDPAALFPRLPRR
jgi:NifU-like protein involved in Fe-S cluster formation